MRTTFFSVEINVANSGEMCSGSVILGLVLALVLAQERHLTIGLNISPLYDWLIKIPSITTRSVALSF